MKIENDESLQSADMRPEFGVAVIVIYCSSHLSYREDAHVHALLC